MCCGVVIVCGSTEINLIRMWNIYDAFNFSFKVVVCSTSSSSSCMCRSHAACRAKKITTNQALKYLLQDQGVCLHWHIYLSHNSMNSHSCWLSVNTCNKERRNYFEQYFIVQHQFLLFWFASPQVCVLFPASGVCVYVAFYNAVEMGVHVCVRSLSCHSLLCSTLICWCRWMFRGPCTAFSS